MAADIPEIALRQPAGAKNVVKISKKVVWYYITAP
jgi:hypothetical protein